MPWGPGIGEEELCSQESQSPTQVWATLRMAGRGGQQGVWHWQRDSSTGRPQLSSIQMPEPPVKKCFAAKKENG